MINQRPMILMAFGFYKPAFEQVYTKGEKMKPIYLKPGQKLEPVQAGIDVRTKLKVGPNVNYQLCENCKNKCISNPPELVESCLRNCEFYECDYP